MPPLLRVVVVAAAACAAVVGASQSSPLTTCGCADGLATEQWVLPAPNTSAVIASVSEPSQCWQLQKTAGGVTCDGLCVVLGPCSGPLTPTWAIEGPRFVVSSPPAQAGWCLDENTAELYIQAYPECLQGDTHQLWAEDVQGRVHEQWTGQNLCVGPGGGGGGTNSSSACPAPPPPPGAAFCYKFHSIHADGLYDPSGPLLGPDGVWHVWEDAGGWSHYTSTDLLRWRAAAGAPTGFGGLTGSVAVTPSGVVAFWPEGNQGGVDAAVSTDPGNFTGWSLRGRVITAPAMAGANFRDPLRAFEWEGVWYVGVGCNNNSQSADLCMFAAEDDTLASFAYAGTAFSTNVTYGQMDPATVAWVNVSVQATMLECPDLFPLGAPVASSSSSSSTSSSSNGSSGGGPSSSQQKYLLVGSLYSTNQHFVGTLSGAPPQFTPESVGIVDYGNLYAAKSGSTYAGLGTDRRVLFGFTGWKEPTADPACGRALVIPRDISLGPDGATPRIRPIPELQSLHVAGTGVGPTSSPSDPLTPGAQVMVSIVCTGVPSSPAPQEGTVYVRVLGTAPAASGLSLRHRLQQSPSSYTEVGYDFGGWGAGQGALYVNHSVCCGGPNSVVQRAPLPAGSLDGGLLNITVLVDGGLVESFGSGLVTITAMVSPDLADGAPEARTTVWGGTAVQGGEGGREVEGMACTAQSWGLASIPPSEALGARGRRQ